MNVIITTPEKEIIENTLQQVINKTDRDGHRISLQILENGEYSLEIIKNRNEPPTS